MEKNKTEERNEEIAEEPETVKEEPTGTAEEPETVKEELTGTAEEPETVKEEQTDTAEEPEAKRRKKFHLGGVDISKGKKLLEKLPNRKKKLEEQEVEEEPYVEIEVKSDAERKAEMQGDLAYVYRGLSEAEVENQVRMGRVNRVGDDIFKTKKEIIKSHTLTYFNFLNLFLAVLILISGQFKNLTFLGVVIVNTLIGIIQELKVKKVVDKLAVITASRAKVIREGEHREIDIHDVVLKDTMLLSPGTQVCADSVVLESDGMEVNESMLTGESKPVHKVPGDKVLSGSFLTAGNGVVQVEHVGEENYASQLIRKAKTKKRASSEMQNTIRKIIKTISVLIIPIGILLYLSQRASGSSFSDNLVSTVAGVIGMIPEGLVLLTSISFILGVGRLARKRALVQEMEAIEALARVNVLCLDKTGTITTGKLEVVEVVGLKGTESSRVENIMNELSFVFDDVNNTQEALMRHFRKSTYWRVEEKIPFSSDRKYRAVRFENQGCFVLGAPEFLLDQKEKEIRDQIDAYAREGLRVLLLGSCESIDPAKGSVTQTEPVGLIVISDCIRPEAPEIFRYFREQHVHIKVISGDNPVTVSQIAKKAGLEGAEHYVDANTLPEDFEELKKVVGQYTVYGRVKPEQKQNIIRAYQANKGVVGMVGDGVNDVLALKDADCGIAMAAGSDAAKQVAHIVLLDSDFACLKNIVSEGRTIISNIERVSALYLTKTIYSIILCVLFIFMAREYPFIPIQLSWISATAIGIPSFLLALEQNETVSSRGFLRQVLRVALPEALTMVVSLLTIQTLSFFWQDQLDLTYTFNMLVGGAVSMMVVFKVCRPMNWRRRILSVSVAVLFVVGVLLAPGFLGILSLDRREMIFMIPMICMVLVFSELFTKMVVTGYFIRDWLTARAKKLMKKE
jgi:cation-transporting ATPase E